MAIRGRVALAMVVMNLRLSTCALNLPGVVQPKQAIRSALDL
jgi:hypothetical protein